MSWESDRQTKGGRCWGFHLRAQGSYGRVQSCGGCGVRKTPLVVRMGNSMGPGTGNLGGSTHSGSRESTEQNPQLSLARGWRGRGDLSLRGEP